jgi:flagellar hook-length control protein FliK
MTRKSAPADKSAPESPRNEAVDEAIARALEAATAATEAAHEAEAVLAARSEAALAMGRLARRSGLMAGVAGAAAILGLGLGGLLWLRASADLREAAELQAAASAVFVERLAEMNGALDRLDGGVLALEAGTGAVEGRLAALITDIETGLAEARNAPAPTPDPALIERIDRLRADMIEAIAETQIAIAQQTLPAPAPALTPTPAQTAATPAAAKPATPPKPRPQPAKPRPAKPKQDTNPFRFP